MLRGTSGSGHACHRVAGSSCDGLHQRADRDVTAEDERTDGRTDQKDIIIMDKKYGADNLKDAGTVAFQDDTLNACSVWFHHRW